jgi:DNA-binding IclR family transcriptional regulator
VLAQADDADRETAERCRAEWAGAPWVRRPESADGTPDQIAVPLVDAHGVTVAALAAAVPAGASDAAVASIAAQLTRTAASAVRTLGHA